MKKVYYAIIVVFILFIGIKGCIIKTAHFEDYILLELLDSTETDRVIITPKNEMVIIKKYKNETQLAIYKIRGVEATHYFGGIYNVSSFNSEVGRYGVENPLLGIRYYSGAKKVYKTTLEVEKKFGDSFPDVGKKFNARIVFFKDRMKIGDYEYKILPVSENDRDMFVKMISEVRKS